MILYNNYLSTLTFTAIKPQNLLPKKHTHKFLKPVRNN